MNDKVILKAENVSKKFTRSLRRSMYYGAKDVVKSMLGMKIRTDMLRPDEFWAADGITFELKQGESLGVIGENGSGKSTLLRLLCGIYKPDKGRIEVGGGLAHSLRSAQVFTH